MPISTVASSPSLRPSGRGRRAGTASPGARSRTRPARGSWHAPRTSDSRSSRTARETSGPSSPTRDRRHSCVPDHTLTPCSTVAHTTERSAWSRRSSRSRRCAARSRGPRRPLAVGCMVDEEGPRFDAAIFGSRMLCGELAIDPLLARVDRDGHTLGELAAARGVTPASLADAPSWLARIALWLEVHVEQGVALVDVPARSASPPVSRRASAGVRRSRALRTMRGRPRWRAAAMRSSPRRVRSWPPSSSRAPSPGPSRPSAASRRARARATSIPGAATHLLRRARTRRRGARACARWGLRGSGARRGDACRGAASRSMPGRSSTRGCAPR